MNFKKAYKKMQLNIKVGNSTFMFKTKPSIPELVSNIFIWENGKKLTFGELLNRTDWK